MNAVLSHLRNKLAAGLFAAIPVAVVAYGAWWIEQKTKALAKPLGIELPGMGLLLALAGLYLLGLALTSFLGRWLLEAANAVLQRVPGLNLIYRAWKDVLCTPLDQAGMFHQAVFVPTEGGGHQLGFTHGTPLPGDPSRRCVFLPNLPNPFSGRLVLVAAHDCVPAPFGVEEAMKYQLSGGNFLPAGLGAGKP